MSFYTDHELREIGFAGIGKNVLISRKASIYNAAQISIGDFSRIDDFCVLSAGAGGIQIGCNVHIAVYSGLIGHGSIELANFSNISSRVMIYSSNDDYSGGALTNPTLPPQFTNVTSAPVRIEKHVIIGSGSIILPGVILEEGVAIGALSLVNCNCERFCIYAGSPAKFVRSRSEKLLESEQKYLDWLTDDGKTNVAV